MGPLAAVERFLERLFERQSARLFRTAIRPVQVQRRLERSMEGERVREGGRTVVPHRFAVLLHPDDLAGLQAAAPRLAADLADGALAFARSHGYTLLDRPVVALQPDPHVATGDIDVVASDPRDGDGDENDVDERDMPADGATSVPTGSGSDPGHAGPGGVSEQTAVFVIPDAEGPRATMREIRPDRSSRTVTYDGRPMTIGRAADNRLVLRDGRASRHHARIEGRRGTLVLTDLGSTHGSFVNDRRVESIALGEGDRIRIGLTTLVLESIEAGEPESSRRAQPAGSAAAATGGPADAGPTGA